MASSNPIGDQATKIVTIRNAQSVSGSVVSVQEVSTQATGGTFFLLFEGARSTSLDFDASAAEVDAALITMPGISAVGVTGAGTGSSPWIITFTTLVPAVRPAGKLDADTRLLTGPIPTVMVRVTTLGETAGLRVLGHRVVAIEQPANTEGTDWQFLGDLSGNGTFVVINADDGSRVVVTKSTSAAEVTRLGAEVATALAGYHSIQFVTQAQVNTEVVLTILLEKI